MKIKLSRLAFLLLAAAGFAVSACTDYSVDINQVKNDVANLKTEVASLKSGDIATLKSQVSALETAKESLETQMKSVQQSVADLTKTTEELKAEDKALDSKISGVNSALESYKGVVDGKFEAAGKAAQAALDKAVAEIQLGMQTISTKVNEVENGYLSADAALASKISAVESGYKTADQTITGNLEALQVQVNANTASIKSLASTVATLSSDLEKVDAAYKAADAKIEDAYKAADSKNFVELQKQMNDIKTELTENLSSAKSELAASIVAVQGNLDKAVANFSDSLQAHAEASRAEFAAVKKYIDAQISLVEENYQSADAALKSDYEASDKKLKEAYEAADEFNKAELKAQIEKVEKDYIQAIKTLKEEHDAKIAELQNNLAKAEQLIADNKAEAAKNLLDAVKTINDQLADLTAAYQKADKDLAAEYKKADEILSNDILANKSAISDNAKKIIETKSDLEEQIAQVVADYKTAVAALAKVVDENKNLAEQALLKAVTDFNTQLAALRSDYIAADKVIEKAYIAADEVVTAAYQAADSKLETAYQAADLVLEGKISVLMKELTDLKSTLIQQIAEVKAELVQKIADVNADLASYKATVAGEIARLDTRIDDLTKSLEATNATIVSLSQRMEDSDKAIQTDLTEFKTITNKNIEDLQDAVELLATWQALAISQIAENSELIDANATAIGVNAAAIAQIKEDLNDYVLTTVFDAEVAKIYAEIATKLDISEFEAYQSEISEKLESIEAAYKEADEAIKKAYAEADADLQEQIDELNETVATLATKKSVKALADALEALTSRVDEAEGDIVSLTEGVDANAKAIAALDSFTKELKSLIESNTSAISANKTAISLLKEALTVLTGRVSGNETKIAELYTLLATLTGRVDAAEVKLGEFGTRIADNETAIAALQTLVDKNKTAIAALTVIVNSNTQNIQNLDERVTTLEADVENLKEDLTELSQTVENNFNTLKELIDANAGTISELNTKLADLKTKYDAFVATTKAAIEKLNGTVYDETTGLVTRIAIAETDIANINTEISNLQTAISDLKEELNGRIDREVETLGNRIGSAESRISVLETLVGSQGEAIKKLQDETAQLLARIQSLVYVPAYSDGKATLNFVQSGTEVYPAYSQLVYKVYPKECVKALTAENVSFEVVAVQDRYRTRAEEAPALQIVSIVEHPQTDGAVIVTVVPQNMTDMVPVETTTGQEPARGQSYSFSLKVQNEETGDIRTSEFTNAVPSNLKVWLDPYYGFVKNEGTIDEEIEYIPYHGVETKKPYTSTDDVDITQGITPFFTSGNETDGYKHYTVAYIKNIFGVELTVNQVYARSYAILPNHDVKIEDYDKARILTETAADTIMLFKNYADAIGIYDPHTPVIGGLSDANESIVRRKAIRVLEKIQLVAATPAQDISQGQGARATCYYRVTKEYQKVRIEDVTINWDWSNDVNKDAYYYQKKVQNDPVEAVKQVYARENLPATPNALDVIELASKGCTLDDFNHKAADTVVVNCTGKMSMNPDFRPNVYPIIRDRNLYFNINNVRMGYTYTFVGTWKFDFIDVDVELKTKTVDRDRTPVTYTYSDTSFVYTKNIVKEDAFGATATKADPGIKVPMFNTIAALGYFPATAETKAFDADYFNGLVFDNGLYKDASDHAFMYPASKDRAVCNYKLTYKDGLKPIKCWYTFYTWYGQQITFEKNVKFTAPAYDFKHNSYFVSQDAEGNYFSQVNPMWDPKQTQLTKFDVKTVDPNAAFNIVDGDGNIVVKQTTPQTTLYDATTGLAASFAFRTTPQSSKIKMNYQNYCIEYYGYDETVPVYGMLFIVSHKGTPDEFWCQIPNTKFKVGNDYGTYYVKKFNPLPKENFKTTQDVEQKVMSSMTYTFNPFQYLSLMDYRGVSDQTGVGTVSYQCIDKNNGYWILGTSANGFTTNVRANDAYNLASQVSYSLEGAPEEVKNYVKLDPSTMKVVFDYNQKLDLVKPFTLKIKVVLDNTFEKPNTMVAEVNVNIVPIN